MSVAKAALNPPLATLRTLFALWGAAAVLQRGVGVDLTDGEVTDFVMIIVVAYLGRQVVSA